MRKRVTFVENLQNENLLKNGNGHILRRSLEFKKKCTDGFGCLSDQQVTNLYRGTNMSTGSQHMKTINIPKSMMSAPFLQHPALTTGQRRYLCSIANVYSTEHMKRLRKQHYLDVLRACLQPGQTTTCRRRSQDHHQRENSRFTKDAEKQTREKAHGQRRSSSNVTSNSEVIFPKIVNR